MDNAITAQEAINSLGKISKAKFIAMDRDGQWYWYVKRPIIGHSHWLLGTDGGGYGELTEGLFNIQSAKDWRKSLVEYQP